MAAIKLTGGFAGAALLLYVLLRKRGGKIRFIFFFALAGALFATMFYQRPWIATGNPCYPYLGGLFGAPEAMTSSFHHQLGTAKFAGRSVVTLILLLPGLTFPALSRMFDGVYGLQMLLWSFLALIALWRRPKRICAAFLPLAFLAGAWLLTSPQARFLIPALAFLALLLRDAFPLVRGRAGRIVLWAAVAFALFSFPPSVYSSYGANLRATASGGDGRRDILYGRTGDSMLPAVDILLDRLSGGGKCLLVLEERTLYFPRGCEIGTPFFQDKYFPGGKIPDADGLMRNILLVTAHLRKKDPDPRHVLTLIPTKDGRDYILFNFAYADRAAEEIGLLQAALLFAGLVWPGTAAQLVCLISEPKNRLQWYNALFYLVSLLSAGMSGRGYYHYAIILLPGMIIPFASFFDLTEKLLRRLLRKTGAVDYRLIMLSFLLAAGAAFLYRHVSSGADQEEPVVRYLTEHTDAGDDVLILGNSCRYYIAADRKTENRFFYQIPPLAISSELYADFEEELERHPSDLILLPGGEEERTYMDEALKGIRQQLLNGAYRTEEYDWFEVFLRQDHDLQQGDS